MVFSAVSSTSYHRPVSQSAEGQARRDGHSARLFNLPAREVANDEAGEITTPQRISVEKSQQLTQGSLEKWLRLMGAARQVAYEDEQQTGLQGSANNMRYRLQRTYFDQERQNTPPSPRAQDPRLQAYRAASGYDSSPQAVDFMV